MVKVKLFRDNGEYRDPVFVSVNGENYLIRRGEEVEVPEKIAYVLEESLKQDECTAALIDKTEMLYEENTRKKAR